MTRSLLRAPTLLALTTALISGVSVWVNKYAVSTIADPVLFSAVKNTIVAIFLVALVLMSGGRREVASLSKQEWKRLIAVGCIGGAVPFALFFTGLALIPAVTGAFIHKTLFVWVALCAMVVLHERFNVVQWIGVALLFVANIPIGGFSGLQGSYGELLVFLATLFWAIEYVLAKRILTQVSSVVVATARMVFGSAFLLLFLTVTGRIGGLSALTAETLMWSALTACFLLGYVLTWYAALSLAPASYVAALLVPGVLVTNTLVSISQGSWSPVFGEQALLLVLGTVFVVVFARRGTPPIATPV